MNDFTRALRIFAGLAAALVTWQTLKKFARGPEKRPTSKDLLASIDEKLARMAPPTSTGGIDYEDF